MKLIVTAVRDNTHQEYTCLATETSDIVAIRNFESSVYTSKAHEDGLLFTHPEDFTLWQIAEFDSDTGVLSPLPVPVLLRKADEVF